jgi:hypothetical protein
MEPNIGVCETERIAPDTYVIRQYFDEGALQVPVNSMVITGAEPVIVDTALAVTGDAWMDRAFSLVEPADVRWVYLSHDDGDHTGNLMQVLDLCPQATLVTNWFTVGRMAGCSHRSSTAPPPGACSTRAPACTGRPTRSAHRSPTRCSTSASWTRSSSGSRT